MHIFLTFIFITKLGAIIQIMIMLLGAAVIAYFFAVSRYKSQIAAYELKHTEQKSNLDRYKLKINHLLGINQEQQNEIGKLLDIKSNIDDKLTTNNIVITGLNEDIQNQKIKIESKSYEIKTLQAKLIQYENNFT